MSCFICRPTRQAVYRYSGAAWRLLYAERTVPREHRDLLPNLRNGSLPRKQLMAADGVLYLSRVTSYALRQYEFCKELLRLLKDDRVSSPETKALYGSL